MRPLRSHSSAPVWRRAGDALLTLVAWAGWLVLGSLAALQVYVLCARELSVPGFVLRRFERTLEASGLTASFGATRFDPSGRLVVENVRLYLAGFEEPVAEARALYVRMDPSAALAGRFVPLDERATGVSVRVPAMFSPSGRADEIVRDLDFEVQPRGGTVRVDYFTGWIGDVAVSGSGTLPLPPKSGPSTGALPEWQVLARHYGPWSRRVAAELAVLRLFERPLVQVRLSSDRSGRAHADVNAFASAVTVERPFGVSLRSVRAATEWSVSSGGGDIRLWAESATLPHGVTLRSLSADLSHLAMTAGSAGLNVTAGATRFGAAALQGDGISVTALGAEGDLTHYPRVAGEIGALAWGEPVSVTGSAAMDERSGAAQFDAAVGSGVLEAVGRRVGANLRQYVSWGPPLRVTGEANFRSGWTFASARAHVIAHSVVARGVTVDEARADIRFDGRRLLANRAYARVGTDLARGDFEGDLVTHRYRFVLNGQLRPLDITPWIAGDWWPDFFGRFRFPGAPPKASIDLRGNWSDGRQASVFVAVAAPGTTVDRVRFDALEGRLFVRPEFEDGLQFLARIGSGAASGHFVRRYNLAADAWQSVSIAVESTLDPSALSPLLGASGPDWLGSCSFTQGPRIVFAGRFTGPGAPEGEHRVFTVSADARERFRFHDFPFDKAAFAMRVNDDAIDLTSLQASVAGGLILGTAQLRGGGARRTLDFSASVRDASLGQAVQVVEDFSAKQAGRPPPPPGRFIQSRAAVLVDLSMNAHGLLANAYDFQGDGSASLRGGEIGKLHLLGLLSDLLPFTSLRFTIAHALFRIQGPQLIFSDISITGANSEISAHGTYSLDRHLLDFRARLNPFQESHALAQQLLGAVMSPLTGVFQVHLTGTLDKPKWVFANGPSNWKRPAQPPAAAPSGTKPPTAAPLSRNT